ncbi:hypothetical protein KR018_008673 [Drosophila ironensis]|nr:hypothetical protein KR018_008673 [Drosophila ironensis]
MWEKLINCIKGGADAANKKGCQMTNMADILKQVPPNQLTQYHIFAKKHEEYKARVRKFPESLPDINWAHYEQNVRPEMVQWVQNYKVKYDKMHTLFENRHAMIDSKRYFEEIDKETALVQEDICKYKEKSDERIKKLEEKISYLKAMMPYEEMNMEEFCSARPHLAPDFINRPTFWPHTPEEQTPGPTDPVAAAELHHDPPPEKEPPPPPPPPPAPRPLKVPPLPGAKKDEGSAMAEKAAALASNVVAKLAVLFDLLRCKLASMAKDVQDKAAATKASRASTSPSIPKFTGNRESSPDICTQTIIRGEKERNPDVKAHHEDLSIESEEEPCPKKEPCKKKKADSCKKKEDDPCKKNVKTKPVCKPKPSASSSSPCAPKKDPCKKKQDDPCKKKKKDPCKAKKSEDKCGGGGSSSKPPEQTFINIAECSKAQEAKRKAEAEKSAPPKPGKGGGKCPEKASLPETIQAENVKEPVVKGCVEILTDSNQIEDIIKRKEQPPQKQAKDEIVNVKVVEDLGPVTIYPRMEISSKDSKPEDTQASKPDYTQASKPEDTQASKPALMDEAANKVADQESRIEALESAYKSAQEQAERALLEASKAVNAANKLAKRSKNESGEMSPSDKEALAMAQKHALLAQMLATRANTLKDDIAKVLEQLKKKKP